RKADLANRLAWELVSSPNVPRRDPAQALVLARQAVRQAPREATYWNTLGVASYRAKQWEAAVRALEEAEDLAPGKYLGFNALFLAMCQHQLGNAAKAREEFDRAVRWSQDHQTRLPAPHQEEFKAFRAEAEALLAMSRTEP